MKIQRINLVIHSNENKHRKYLYNEMLDLMNKHHFGGEFRNETIKLSSMPDNLLKLLKELDIKYIIKK